METKRERLCNHDLDAADEVCTLFMHSANVFFCEHCDGVFVGMPPTRRNGLKWDQGLLALMRETIAEFDQLPETKSGVN
jgi:hypothetical protein